MENNTRKYGILYFLSAALFTIAIFWALWAMYLKPQFVNHQRSHDPHSHADTNSDASLLFTISGSQSMGDKLMPELAKAYLQHNGYENVTIIGKEEETAHEEFHTVIGEKNNKEEKIIIHSENSSQGFQDLLAGKCDIATSSRKINDTEAASFTKFGNITASTHEHILAMDGVAVIVNGNNPLKTLTKSQLQQIFSGIINNWNQVIPEKSGAIRLYTRDKTSGTYESFNHLVMEGVAINLAAQSYPKGDALSDALAQDVNGIGYVSLPSVKNNKTVSISEGENLTAFYPNPFTIATEDYPLSRRLYTYHLPTAKEEAKKFIEFCLSDEGEQIASQTGFVGLNLSTQSQVAALPNTQIPQEYKTITQNAVRENFNIHFISGSAAIDNKATQDLYHFSQQYGHLPPEKQIRLIGFTDNVGNPSQNLSLSKERAGAVAKTLQNYGMKADIKSFGLGQQMPIGNNATIQGKDKNRRVEVWIK